MIGHVKLFFSGLLTLFLYIYASSGKSAPKISDINANSFAKKNALHYGDIHQEYVYEHVSRRNGLNYFGHFHENLHSRNRHVYSDVNTERDEAYYAPGDVAENFTLDTIAGELKYPGEIIHTKTPVLFHAYDDKSAFQRCLWHCEGRITPIITRSPANAHYVFMSYGDDAENDVKALSGRFEVEAQRLISAGDISQDDWDHLKPRLHYVITPVTKLGNWITAVLSQWLCKNHNCGLDQVRFVSPDLAKPTILRRLNARAYWLPFPGRTYKDRVLDVTYVGPGCVESAAVLGKVALLTDGECSAADKIYAMEASGAIAVLVMGRAGEVLVDMYCNGDECKRRMSTPSAMIEHHPALLTAKNLTVRFQNTPNHNYYVAIDGTGSLAEVGWLITPTLDYLVWMAEWFNYRLQLTSRLDIKDKLSIPVMNELTMKGSPGAQASVKMPAKEEFNKYTKMQLDMALTCPGTRDVTCAEWDRTVVLRVCCKTGSQLCDMELGRWISPYRRRIGRWLTDVTSLMPLLDGDVCNFTMSTDAWSMPWIVTLNIILSEYAGNQETNDIDSAAEVGHTRPFQIRPLYQPGFTFNKDFNKNFAPISFNVPAGTIQTKIVAVITGHGSDNNQCAEFCVTSHHFVVNGNTAEKVFSDAGSTLGCSRNVSKGATPNEHGTWVYGRAGWCPGLDVTPWEIDVTGWLSTSSNNTVHYYGLFNGTDPNPSSSPGSITISSFVVFYKNV